MRCLACCSVVLCCSAPIFLSDLAALAAQENSRPPDIQEMLQGKWLALECVRGGESVDPSSAPSLTFADSNMRMIEGQQALVGDFRVDTTTDPPQILFQVPGAQDPMRIAFGLEARRLTLCFNLAPVSPDGTKILTGSFDRSMRLWDLATGRQLRRFTHDGWVFALAFSPDGKRALAATDTDDEKFPVAPLYLWELETGRQLHRIPAHRGGVTSCAFSPDGKVLLSCGYDGAVRLWDADTGDQLQPIRDHSDWVWSIACSPNGEWAITAGGGAPKDGGYSAGEDFAIRVWNLPLITEMARRQAQSDR